jgi:polyhydroxybutyrate depolymerase
MTPRSRALTGLSLAVAVASASCQRRDNTEPAARTEAAPSAAASSFPEPEPASREFAFGTGKVHFFGPETGRPAFVLVLHGLGGSGTELADTLGLQAFALERHFLFAAPDGTPDAQGRRFWNANEVCCNFGRVAVNDVERLMALIDYAVGSLHADAKRVYVVGYSNGGFMAHRLACEQSRRVRAIVSIAAAGPDPSQHCEPSEPVRVLEIHGDRDAIVPFEGGHLFGRAEMPRVPSVPSSLQVWANEAQCGGELLPVQSFDLIAELPGNDTESFHFSNCRANSPLLWKVKGGAHFIRLGAPALGAIWEFLAAPS